MNTGGYTIVDVRSEMEFEMGHVEGSMNIPLQQVPDHLEDLANMKQPLVLCCASGNRSGQAVAYLRQQGIECENWGGWVDVKFRLQER